MIKREGEYRSTVLEINDIVECCREKVCVVHGTCLLPQGPIKWVATQSLSCIKERDVRAANVHSVKGVGIGGKSDIKLILKIQLF